METVKLSAVEIKVLNKLGLTKSSIFEPTRIDAKDNLDAVSYIWVKWFIEKTKVLSISIFYEKGRISFSIFDKETETKESIDSKQFREYLTKLELTTTSEDIDNI